MKHDQKQKFDNLDDEQELWNLMREVRREQGIDLDGFLREAVEHVTLKLPLPGPRADFMELEQAGCSPVVLGLLVALIHYTPTVKQFWETAVGIPNERRKAKKELEATANRLKRIFASTLNADHRIKEKLSRSPILMPSQLISQLKLYVKLITFAERLAEKSEVHSLDDFAKYLLAAYVKRATGNFCDRQVSGVLAGLIGPTSFDDTAQRVWRRRNYARLETHLSRFADMLNAMGIVTGERERNEIPQKSS
jgi:hypothetical protein